MFKFFPREKVILTGNPIREDILGFNDKKQEGARLFNLDNKKLTVLVIGGSLGALTINKAIAKNIHKFKDNGVNLIWQTGKAYYQKSTKCISDVKIKGINSYAFIKHMNLAYASSDIIISRAGAMSIAELCCIGKPIILVPSPNVSENHQFKNAQSLVNKNAALLVDDAEVSCKLVSTLEKLLCDQGLMNSLSINIKKLSVFDAADRITKIALDLLK
jgi:UDP-N-acetylglucosamine--N-acetylmuramyl-(pentapeptide) pyrophosphoryl-undecaprenol N-acetylglucosamine transferase